MLIKEIIDQKHKTKHTKKKKIQCPAKEKEPEKIPSIQKTTPELTLIDGKMVLKEARIVSCDDDHLQPTIKEAKVKTGFKWSDVETEMFYKALQVFGTDFSMIEKELLVGRKTRKQIKVLV